VGWDKIVAPKFPLTKPLPITVTDINRLSLYLYRVRKSVGEWLELHRRPQSLERDKEIATRVVAISRFLPDPLKAQEFLAKFSKNMLKDNSLLLGKPLYFMKCLSFFIFQPRL
jgi:hypothetical protein